MNVTDKLKERLIVIKIGGNAITDNASLEDLAEDIRRLKKDGAKPVIVHGGGPFIKELLEKGGVKSEFIGGHRKTGADEMRFVEMALNGEVNGNIVGTLNRKGVKSFGLSGKDGLFAAARKRMHTSFTEGKKKVNDLGQVGNIVKINNDIVLSLLDKGITPVISPVCAGIDGDDYNVNADSFAGNVAGFLNADTYISVTNVNGLYEDKDNPDTLIKEISYFNAEELLKKLEGGMIPKIESCLTALRKGVTEALIINGTKTGALYKVFTERDFVSTKIKREEMDRSIVKENKHHFAIYKRFPVTMDHGRGCRLWDTDGKEYIDALGGIAVNILGYSHPALVDAIQKQAARLIHVSNLYYTEPQSELAEKLTSIAGYDRVFFSNSGVEAIEGAVKLARKTASKKGKKGKILFLENSFHGRTLTALAMGKEKYQKGFEPIPEGFESVPGNDFEAFKEKAGENTIAFIAEAIQGEGGIVPADAEWMKKVSEYCRENDIIFIADEIQCGMGRTGKFFGFENYGIRPDIVATAKGLGGGFPIGAVLADDDIASSFGYGDHGTTFGGNALACAASGAVLDTLINDQLIPAAAEKGEYLFAKLNELKEKHSVIEVVRGKGLMAGVVLNKPCADIVKSMMDKGVIANCAAEKVIRLLPPLIIEKEEIDKIVMVIDAVLTEEKNG